MMFTSTRDTYGERRKAMIKNHNLPILQELYGGSRQLPLACSITGDTAFVEFPCLVRGQPMQRFRIDFNHIRQRALPGRQAGVSVDRSTAYNPSDLFRSRPLDDGRYGADLTEFMTIIPLTTEYHSYVTQSSSYGDVTLQNYDRNYWPWHLQNPGNFQRIVDQYELAYLDWLGYWGFIDHLSDITHPAIRTRLAEWTRDQLRPGQDPVEEYEGYLYRQLLCKNAKQDQSTDIDHDLLT